MFFLVLVSTNTGYYKYFLVRVKCSVPRKLEYGSNLKSASHLLDLLLAPFGWVSDFPSLIFS